MTALQLQALALILARWRAGAAQPTRRELAAHLGGKGLGTATRAIDQLEAAGFIRRVPGAWRSIRPLRDAQGRLLLCDELFDAAVAVAFNGAPLAVLCGALVACGYKPLAQGGELTGEAALRQKVALGDRQGGKG